LNRHLINPTPTLPPLKGREIDRRGKKPIASSPFNGEVGRGTGLEFVLLIESSRKEI
jgi:hypothetical protein